jgi:prepilin-type processing-associated H-X9-DG protein
VTHGHKDRTIAFADGSKLADLLEQAGATVTFVELDGGHEITDEVEAVLATFTMRCVE